MQELWTILKKWRERPVVSFVLSQLARPIYRVAIWITRRVPWAIRVNGATVDFDGISLVFPTDVGITYCTLGWWQGVAGYEPATWQTLKFYFQQAEVFWDVGSNIGLYAVLAKKTNPSLRVEAFEPVPSLAEANRKFQQANQTGIEPRQVAVSHHGHGAELAVPRYSGITEVEPTATLENEVNLSPGAGIERVKVATTTLDALAGGLRPADRLLIKIDVEGHEHCVLEGAQELLATWRPIMLCEILPGIAQTGRLASILSAAGYALLAVCREGLFQIDPADLDKKRTFTDYVLLPSEKLKLPGRYHPFGELPH